MISNRPFFSTPFLSEPRFRLSSALAAARALLDSPKMSAYDVAKKAMTIAADTCVYTNHNFTHQIIGGEDATTSAKDDGEAEGDAASSSP